MSDLISRSITVLQNALKGDNLKDGINLQALKDKNLKESDDYVEWATITQSVTTKEIEKIVQSRLPGNFGSLKEEEKKIALFKVLYKNSELRSELLKLWQNKNQGKKLETVVKENDAKTYDRFEAAADGLDYLMKSKSKGKEIGDILTADEIPDSVAAIAKLDGNKEMALPKSGMVSGVLFDGQGRAISESDAKKNKNYQEQALFSLLIKQKDSATDVDKKYADDGKELATNIDLDSIEAGVVNTKRQAEVAESLKKDAASFDQGVVASFQSDLAALKKGGYKGLGGNSIIAYCELFMKYVKLFPAPSGTRWLASQFINNIGGTFTFLDPFSPIYSSFYLPGDSPDLAIQQINTFLSSIYASRVQKIISDTDSPAVNFILEGKTEKGESLLGASGNKFSIDDFDNSIKQHFKIKDLKDAPPIVQDLSAHLRANKPAKWQDARQAAGEYLKSKGTTVATDMAQALGLDSESSKIILFINITTDSLKRLQETLKAKQEAAKAVLDQLQKGFQQPGAQGRGGER